jgi:hypothetical protein
MLVEAPARGLPGTIIDRVEMQRAPQGMHLDDVIVRAHDRSGKPAILEIQVKRTITFAPKDPIFKEVVEQIAKTVAKPDFWAANHQLGIATSATSRKIHGPYQDVLTWARQIGDAKTFMEQVERAGTSNDDARSFVATFHSHLKEAGALHDDETVWKVLRRLHILTFDFTAPESSAQELAQERCARALEPGEAGRAADLWKLLTEIVTEAASSAGDRDRPQLLEDLQKSSFRLAPASSNAGALRVLADLSRSALEDIDDAVSGISLPRADYSSAVHTALDGHRYVDIRGDAGVGKSGILRHFAEQLNEESPVLVLTPERTPGGGWLELRSKLGFDGNCHELLCDLSRNGSAIVFIDNLDFFPREARLTAIDILREAESVPGLTVITTARREYGEALKGWLPQNLIDKMKPSSPILVEELTDAETSELLVAAPHLGWLLSENHPARAVTRNLYRLSRLSSLSQSTPVPLSEAEMALRWWSVADGEKDAAYIDRARLLKGLAKQVLAKASHLDTTGHPAGAIHALVQSETLRELGIDRVKFRHDVLREWAAANLLFSEQENIDLLPLKDAPPPDLARAVELMARMAIERSEDSTVWQGLLQRFGAEGVNPLWRRAILLSLPRSEVAIASLIKASPALFENDGALLRELIRTAMAVDSEPASKYIVVKDPEKMKLPEGFIVPSGPTWTRLIRWFLAIPEYLPVAAIPEVARLFGAWCMTFMGQDPLTPRIVRQAYAWLTIVEDYNHPKHNEFQAKLKDGAWTALATEVRETFLLFCSRTPELASQYVKSFEGRKHAERSILQLLKFRGSLAQAAPKELADATIRALIPPEADPDDNHGPGMKGPFGFADYQFHPISPAQGPFYDILSAAPAEGLRLIRTLVNHAISSVTGGRDPGDDLFTIQMSGGPRTFPWRRSYVWSRKSSDAPGIVTSALMALTLWAHRRIESGEPIQAVLDDVIGDGSVPAAYLLVVVDLLISHWPKSREAAVPYLGCPDLLSDDRNRLQFDVREELDLPAPFNLLPKRKEPIGLVSVEELEALPSHRQVLDQLLDNHANYLEPLANGEQQQLQSLLETSASQLGEPDSKSNLLDPSEMVRYSLNRLNHANWKPAEIEQADGQAKNELVYEPPPEEAKHFAQLLREANPLHVDASMVKILGQLLSLPGRATPEFIIPSVEWAQKKAAEPSSGDENFDWVIEEAILSVALIAARDGGPVVRNLFRPWLTATFQKALQAKDDDVHRVRGGLKFNAVARAFLGHIHLLKDQHATDELRGLLAIAGRSNPAAAHGMAQGAYELSTIDERLPRAVLRTAFLAMNKPDRDWDAPEQEYLGRIAAKQQSMAAHIKAEISWLENRGPEPAWPQFVPKTPYLEYGRRDRFKELEERIHSTSYTDSQGAALWLTSIEELLDVPTNPWLVELVATYKDWTKNANGFGFDPDDHIDGEPDEWNAAYLKIAALPLIGANDEHVDAIIDDHLSGLPENALFEQLATFLGDVDQLYFNAKRLSAEAAVRVRSRLAQMVRTTHDWKNLRGDRKQGAEVHLAEAISVLFFANGGSLFEPSKSYLLEPGMPLVTPFLSILSELVADNPSPYVGDMALLVPEVSPRPEHAELLLACAQTWMPIYKGNSLFWRDYRFGQRWCRVMRKILAADPGSFASGTSRRVQVDHILAYLVTEGVPEAGQLEEALRDLDSASSGAPARSQESYP